MAGSNRLYEVNLVLTADNDPELSRLTEYIRKERCPNSQGSYRLGSSLSDMGQFHKAEEISQVLLDQTNDDENKASIYHQLGMLKRNRGKYEEAHTFYEKSLALYQKTLHSNHPDLASSYNSIGAVHDSMENYPKALLSLEKTLKIQQQLLPSNHSTLQQRRKNLERGGFGSLLRSFGKQILISKNKEACRDLTGRRMRDVNNEKKLQEWMQKQLEKSASSSTDQKNKASQGQEEKTDYRNVPPPHKFSDTAYDEQKKQIADNIDEAVQIAAEKLTKKKKSTTAVSTRDDDNDDDEKEIISKKRHHSDDTLEDGELKNKKTKKESGATGAFFLGIDVGDVSSDDDDEEEIQAKNAKKKKSIKKA
ncbi:unnamed protein product [Adineta steineri]|uniref:SDE2-like domain-containing protein n=1 Tax=Adineta steineri TaxID=433720 RepID=A0A813VAG5_9BILA|nr:unnamed protein product [Adineta steineri]CAF0834720.1 unnamed protein product [Adineta steineri]